MRRHGNLWPQVVDMENIELAYQRAKHGKTWQRSVARVERRRERALELVRELLVSRTFQTSDYRTKKVYEPKERTIYVLPFFPDRIVQHAVMAVVAPIWDRMFDSASHACRPGKGQHTASRTVMHYVRHYPYVLQGDVSKFYPSINHRIAMEIIDHKIKDPDVLWLLGNIVHSFPGEANVPIGNLTSQWIGNLYLNEFDQFVRSLGARAYIRYNDDFLIFASSKAVLHQWQDRCRDYLRERLALRMAKDRVYPVRAGVDFVGYRHFPSHILIRKSTVRRVKRRVSELSYRVRSGLVNAEHARSAIDSTLGWLRWANAYNLRRALRLDELREEVCGAIH